MGLDDILEGGKVNDSLYGDSVGVFGIEDAEQPGNDILLGGDGKDVVHSGAGDDLLDGGSGDDASEATMETTGCTVGRRMTPRRGRL